MIWFDKLILTIRNENTCRLTIHIVGLLMIIIFIFVWIVLFIINAWWLIGLPFIFWIIWSWIIMFSEGYNEFIEVHSIYVYEDLKEVRKENTKLIKKLNDQNKLKYARVL